MPVSEERVFHNTGMSHLVLWLSAPLFLGLAVVFAYCAFLNSGNYGDRGAIALFLFLTVFFTYFGALGIRWLSRRQPPLFISGEEITEEYFGFGFVP
jgi:hypothetical protein